MLVGKTQRKTVNSIVRSLWQIGIALAMTAIFSPLHLSGAQEVSHAQPKLILQITVDQLRGDLPTRYYNRLGDGGFRYLWENGVVYRNAHHAHANTETIVGHASNETRHSPPGIDANPPEIEKLTKYG